MKNPDEIPVPTSPGAPARPISRRRFLRYVLGSGALFAATSAYAVEIEPFWLDLHELPLPVPNLPPAFEGFRVAQLSDMHTGMTPTWYLQKTIDRLNALSPDLVLITGDLTHHELRFISPALDLIAQIKAPKIAILGNHDYKPFDSDPRAETVLADAIEQQIPRTGCTLLRNRAIPLQHQGEKIWIVGLEDYWSDLFNAPAAFSAVTDDAPRIVLSHNPDSCPALMPYGPTIILSGHTHGGQVRLPLIGALALPVNDRSHDQGKFSLTPDTTLYVSRGVGFLHQIRFLCRPELPIFRLQRA